MAARDRQEPSLSWELLHPEEISRLSTEWDRLVTSAAYPPFMQSAFLSCAIHSFGCNHGRLALGRLGGQLVAGGVVQRLGHGVWTTYQPSQLPLGAWVVGPHVGGDTALRSLLHALPGVAVSFAVTQQDPRLTGRPVARPDCEVMDYVATGWIDVVGSFDEYWKGRGRNLRQNIPKFRRRLAEQGGALTFDWLETPAEVDAAFADYAALESASWKAEGGTAISTENEQGRFYRKVLQEYAQRNAAFGLRLLHNGRPIAVDFGLRDAECMAILKTTYDEGYRTYSPGQLLHEQAFAHVFRHGIVRRIEFYGRLMEWHTRWTEQSRMLFHTNNYRFPLLRSARDVLKRMRMLAVPRAKCAIDA